MTVQLARSKRKWAFFGSTALIVLALCVFFRISRLRDIEAYLGMATECPPVWKQFAFHRLGKGDSAGKFLQRFPPNRREEFGRYGIYHYQIGDPDVIAFTQLVVVTRDDKLISAAAGSCTWQFAFFHTADAELDRQFAAFVKERSQKLELERIKKLGEELKRFYSLRLRWPTNEQEFSLFVPGSTNVPPELDITLTQHNDGTIHIASTEFPDGGLLVEKSNDDKINSP